MKEKRAEKERQTFVDYFYHYFCYCLCDSDHSYLLFTLYVNLSPWTKALALRPQCFTEKTGESKSARKDRVLKDPKGSFYARSNLSEPTCTREIPALLLNMKSDQGAP